MSDEPFFLAHNKALLQATAEDDLLHPHANAAVKGDTLTETQYFGFNVPKENIHGLAYMWYHANLKVVTGGIMAWRGVKRMAIAAELFDFRAFMSDQAIANDLHEFRLDNGYGVKILEPNKRFHMTYADEARGNGVDLVYEAVTPIAMFGDGKHFEQGMKARGKLKLRGRDYDVDCYNVRDRSWGKLRPEVIMPMPPVSWTTGSFGDDLIFNCNMMDHAGSNPQVSGKFALPVDKALNGGWIWRNGKLLLITRARKTITRHPESFVPQSITLHLTTEDGKETVATGTLVASCPWATWPNIMANISLIRWEMDGRVGYGDAQDVLWNDFVNAAAEAQVGA
jgi:hypothetical protein